MGRVMWVPLGLDGSGHLKGNCEESDLGLGNFFFF